MIEGIDRLPIATVVHVVTDTCATMQAAWRIVEDERPWMSATCCAPHVLNLLLKDIASLPTVAVVMGKMENVLSRKDYCCDVYVYEYIDGIVEFQKYISLYRRHARWIIVCIVCLYRIDV